MVEVAFQDGYRVCHIPLSYAFDAVVGEGICDKTPEDDGRGTTRGSGTPIGGDPASTVTSAGGVGVRDTVKVTACPVDDVSNVGIA